tara:strand:- start:350 stop:772 length:423 start_codon:yes stop_codon:yes gene_type:complete
MKLLVDKNLNLDNFKINLIGDFCLFCAEELPIIGDFEIYIISNRSDHDIKTTAAYHVGNNICKVYGKNRALVDILRSIAHEMTHMMQDEQGLLKGHIQDAGGFHEDQANARAGELIKRFAKSKDGRRAIYETRLRKIRIL